MRLSKIWIYCLVAVFITVVSLFETGCANIVPPGGGPRDSLPPVPVSALPKDSALNVTTQKITINFDEFIELKNANEKILISPYPVKQPVTESKLRTVTVRLKDSLLPNTTYTIDFGDAITDLNEGNPLRNFRYTFSTGNTIDTNELIGRIINAENGGTDSTFFALLYKKQEDSTVAKEKPLYVARVNGKGEFLFTNIPAGTFYVYALKDADGDKKYSQPSEGFGFLDSAIQINATTKTVELFAYTEEKEKPRSSSSSAPKATGKPGAVKRLTFSSNLEAGTQDLLDSLKFTYEKPLKFFDSSKIQLFKDSVTPVTTIGFRYDSVNKKIILFTNWVAGASYRLILDEAYAADTTGLKPAKTDTLNFRVRSEKEYGSIRIKFKNLILSKNPVLLLYSNDQLSGAFPLTGTEWLRKLYKPGDYQVRILYDDNKNGLWDPGSYFSKPRRQPEKVQNISTKITIKSNWDNEMNIDIPVNEPPSN